MKGYFQVTQIWYLWKSAEMVFRLSVIIKGQCYQLDHIVAETMKLITVAPTRSNVPNLYKEIGWQLLSKRYEIIFFRLR